MKYLGITHLFVSSPGLQDLRLILELVQEFIDTLDDNATTTLGRRGEGVVLDAQIRRDPQIAKILDVDLLLLGLHDALE